MPIKSIIECCVCMKKEIEKNSGVGFFGWGSLQGIELNGEDNPTLCPEHMSTMARYLDIMVKDHKGL